MKLMISEEQIRNKLFDDKRRSLTIDNILNIKYAENYEQLNILRLK